MTNEQAAQFVEAFHKYYNTENFKFPQTREIYRKVLMRFDFQKFADMLDDIFTTFTFCPKVSELSEFYYGRTRTDTELTLHPYIKDEPNEIKCRVCLDKGYVMYRDEENQWYSLYCDSCQTGNNWKYDGRNRDKNQSPYFVEPVSKIFDPDILRCQNSDVKKCIVPMPDYIKNEFKRLGIPLRILAPKEREKVCPF